MVRWLKPVRPVASESIVAIALEPVLSSSSDGVLSSENVLQNIFRLVINWSRSVELDLDPLCGHEIVHLIVKSLLFDFFFKNVF